jgi:hypothetical protein
MAAAESAKAIKLKATIQTQPKVMAASRQL